jgi:hypothetical protein
MKRRKFLQLSALAGLTPVHAMEPAQKPAGTAGSPKKGFCIGAKSDGFARVLEELRAKWFYTWNHQVPANKPDGVDFVPMIWSYRGREEAVINAAKAAKKAGIKELLGFNEPDQKKQADMTVEEALAAWPVLEKTGLRLGSPGCVHPDKEWMKAFMKEAEELKLRIDFVCVHSYGGADANALVRRLEQVHQLYHKPIWITEFAVGDWTAPSVAENRHKEDAVLRFMEQALPKLDRLDFVERYAWFSAKPDNNALGTSALLDTEGRLTRLGECYRDA